jgi:hypothetical protein
MDAKSTYYQSYCHIQSLLYCQLSIWVIMSSVDNKASRPKAKKAKQNQKNKVTRDSEKTHYPKLSSMTHSNQSSDMWKYIISCRSCFWGTPFNYYGSKTKTNRHYMVCPSCASKNIGYLSIPNNRLFSYVSHNIN